MRQPQQLLRRPSLPTPPPMATPPDLAWHHFDDWHWRLNFPDHTAADIHSNVAGSAADVPDQRHEPDVEVEYELVDSGDDAGAVAVAAAAAVADDSVAAPFAVVVVVAAGAAGVVDELEVAELGFFRRTVLSDSAPVSLCCSDA